MWKNQSYNGVDKIVALWNVCLTFSASCWAYFQPVHHLIKVLLVVILANFFARLAQSMRGYKIRRSRKRRFSVLRWLREVRLTGILLEFFLSCCIVMVMCVIYKTLYPVEEGDAELLLEVTSYGVYIMLIAYILLFLSTLGKAFPDSYLVKVFGTLVRKVNLFKVVGLDKNMDEGTFEDIREIAHEQSNIDNDDGKKVTRKRKVERPDRPGL